MTIEQAKDQAAQEITYQSWNEAVSFPSYGAYTVAAMANKAMIIYGEAKYKEAYNQAINDAAESAEIDLPNGLLCKTISTIEVNGEEFEFNISINKQSILKLLKKKIMERCQNCKFWALKDSGYSNYSVMETTVHCLKKHFSPVEESYSWNRNPDNEFLKQAETCPDFKQEEGVQIHYDVDGDTTIEDFKGDLEVYNAAKEYPLTNQY